MGKYLMRCFYILQIRQSRYCRKPTKPFFKQFVFLKEYYVFLKDIWNVVCYNGVALES